MRRIGIIVVLIVAGLAAVGTGVWSFWSKGDKAPVFRTAPVKRGDLVATISATGTVEPVAAVDIGAQVAGVIIVLRQRQARRSPSIGVLPWSQARCWRESTTPFTPLP